MPCLFNGGAFFQMKILSRRIFTTDVICIGKVQRHYYRCLETLELSYQVAPNREQLGMTATRMRCPQNERDVGMKLQSEHKKPPKPM